MERSKYVGVYTNRYLPTRDAFPYRAALKKFHNGTAQYIDLGFFRSEEAAAHVYNIHSLNHFGRGAIVNDVDVTDEIEAELNEYKAKRRWFDDLLQIAVDVLEEHGPEIMENAKLCTDNHTGLIEQNISH